MSNNQLPADLQARIKADAEAMAWGMWPDPLNKTAIRERGYVTAVYIAGATAWSERAQEILINSLEDAKGLLEYYGDANGIANIDEALQQWEGQKEVGKSSRVYKGLKFKSTAAPIKSYEVIDVFDEEIKVKVTSECQISRTTNYEVLSIAGFEKYYNLGVYYITNPPK